MAFVSATEAVARLEALIAGLCFVSESDAPLRVVRLDLVPNFDAPALLSALGKPATTPISEQPLNALFDRTTTHQPWHGPAERATVERYRALTQFLGNELEGARVFRVGQIEVEVYALGRTAERAWLGVTTTLVET